MPRPHLARVLVTGATGTLGYNIVRHLGAAHPKTRLLVLMRTLDESLFSNLPNLSLLHADMAEFEVIAGAVRKFQPNAIIHCAASGVRPSGIDWFEQIQLNVSATLALFQAACGVADCHFIHVSTGLVYAGRQWPCREHDPIDTLHPYGASKAAADCLLRAGAEMLKRHLTVVRPFSFTGLHDGGDRLFPSLLRAAAERRPLAMSAGTQVRDFCAVQDVAEAIVLLLETGTMPGRDVFNIGSGRSVPLGKLVAEVCAELDLHVEIRAGALPFHPLEPMHLVADTRLIEALGWRPRTSLAYAVWQLARASFPELRVRKPEQFA